MKKWIFLMGASMQFGALSAQTQFDLMMERQKQMDDYKAQFDAFKQDVTNKYQQFVAERNAKYAEFLAKNWKEYKQERGVEPPPPKPYPVVPVKKPVHKPIPSPEKLPIKMITIIPPVAPIDPVFNIPLKAPKPAKFSFDFIGTKVGVALTDEARFILPSVQERDVAEAWKRLSDGRMEEVLSDCQYWKESLQLNDYFYVLMVEEMCDNFFDPSHSNEARLMKSFILTQSGYDAKCGRKGNDLIVLLSIEEEVYQMSFLTINGIQYYIIDEPKDSNGSYFTYNEPFSSESKSCSMRFNSDITNDITPSEVKRFVAQGYPLSVETAVDKNLIEAYNNYPRCKWDIYAKAPMSQGLADVVLPKLREAIAGKSETEAANMLLNFVQTAFEYRTDGEYFGYERSLFVDETFYYPYCDCEDRSILYTNLVTNLLGLDAILLYYPNHLATAVAFDTEVDGDFVVLDGRKFIICDPTYIGANIGEAMPQFRGVEVEAVVL